MAMVYSTAYGLVGTADYKTVDSLINLVKGMSGAVIGATSESVQLLYTGNINATTKAGEAAIKIAETSQGKVFTVADSEVGRLLQYDQCRRELQFAVRNEILAKAGATTVTPALAVEMDARYNEVLYGQTPTGERINSTSM
ncbi:hypothetical protein [Variovorax rhizosphaerae]|uniref:Uncharacterized protein n=1 Tax=Variovorax rhizosphaerae TaxID=1836200 RepID=A0ABU8WQC1_9BURK